MGKTIGICLVSNDARLSDDLEKVVAQFNTAMRNIAHSNSGAQITYEEESMQQGQVVSSDRVFEKLLQQLNQYLVGLKNIKEFEFKVLKHSSLLDALVDIETIKLLVSTEIAILDAGVFGKKNSKLFESEIEISDAFDQIFSAAKCNGEITKITPSSEILFFDSCDIYGLLKNIDGNRQLRVINEDRIANQADLLHLIIDHLEHAHLNRLLARSITEPLPPVTVAECLANFMQKNWGESWDFHYYTGSMVASLIYSMQSITNKLGVRCLTGCNEHNLAVSALAGWQLFSRAYIITVTSGMIDEFRGTLANLKRAKAPGFIICADSPKSSWFAFQGTMDIENDGTQVIEARGLGRVFIKSPSEIESKLQEAMQMQASGMCPVFIFATQAVLESRPKQQTNFKYPALPKVSDSSQIEESENLLQVLDIINNQPRQILWQCGRLNEEERQLIYKIAEKSGIAIADSLIHPGSINGYNNSEPMLNYIGPFAMYGFSRKAYQFLHTDNELNATDSQTVFFLKSRLDQAATPFSEGKLKRQLHIVQVNSNLQHMSPFTDLQINSRLVDFLKYIYKNLKVAENVLQLRNERLKKIQAISELLPSDHIATIPMSVNFFFGRMGVLVDQLIRNESYDYIGVYDVGRCGISAIRNIPRTRTGFSGWYGRALMGDGLAALPYVALNSKTNILAFVGDGARALVPRMEERILSCFEKNPEHKNISINLFYLCNGVLSLIQTYLDKRYSYNGSDQVAVDPIWETLKTTEYVASNIHRTRLLSFDQEVLSSALQATGKINIFEVLLSHNSEGDGLSLVSEMAWNRQS